jgi:hypothetical protein
MPMTADRFGEVVVRIYHVANANSEQSFQEIATLVRFVGDIRRVFTYSSARSLLVRSDAHAADLSAWLLTQVDVPATVAAKSSGAYQYDTPYDRDNLIRVFYLPQTATIQDFQQIATKIRTTTKIRRAFTYNQPRAIALRGTFDQLGQAEQMIKEIQTPNEPRP